MAKGFDDIPSEEGLNVISPPRITNIARRTGPRIQAEPVPSVSVPSQPTNHFPQSKKSKLVNADLGRIRTIYGILDEYKLRVANKKERPYYKKNGF